MTKSTARPKKRHRGRKSKDVQRDGVGDTEVVFKIESLTAATAATTTIAATTTSPRGRQNSPRRSAQKKRGKTSVGDDDDVKPRDLKRKRKRRTLKDAGPLLVCS